MLPLRPQDRQVRFEVFAETNPSTDACAADACTADACTADACAHAEADAFTHTCTDAKAGPVRCCGDVRCAWNGRMLPLRRQDRQLRLEVFAETNPSADACAADACTADACTADACANTDPDATTT